MRTIFHVIMPDSTTTLLTQEALDEFLKDLSDGYYVAQSEVTETMWGALEEWRLDAIAD